MMPACLLVVMNHQQGDELVTDVEGIQRAIEELGSDNVVAVVTTTSCFAPR
jgi:O-phospho-L-seryl-tRNASec:L-selenocysteinyl-tRNA synthase